MHPVVLAIIAGLSAAIPVVIMAIKVGGPFAGEWLKAHLAKGDLQRLHASLKGAAVVVSGFAKTTPGFALDDGFAEVLNLAADEVGRALVEKYGVQASSYVAALHADPEMSKVHLGEGDLRASLENAKARLAASKK